MCEGVEDCLTYNYSMDPDGFTFRGHLTRSSGNDPAAPPPPSMQLSIRLFYSDGGGYSPLCLQAYSVRDKGENISSSRLAGIPLNNENKQGTVMATFSFEGTHSRRSDPVLPELARLGIAGIWWRATPATAMWEELVVVTERDSDFKLRPMEAHMIARCLEKLLTVEFVRLGNPDGALAPVSHILYMSLIDFQDIL